MKLQIINVYEMEGTSRKNPEKPRDYRMLRLVALQSYQNVQTDDMRREGVGLETMEVTVSDDFLPILKQRFAQHFRGQPLLWDMDTGLVSRGRNTETIIVGFVVDPGNLAAAPSQKVA